MSLGETARRFLGPQVERHITRAYRRLYIDLDDLGRTIGRLGSFSSIAEIGCGDGEVTTRLAAAFPAAQIVGIDVAANPGGMFDGDQTRVSFETIDAGILAERSPGAFDLVVVVDVLHHVSQAERLEFLGHCHTLVAPGGLMLVKEWEQRWNLVGLLALVSDRYVTGDRGVQFLTRTQLLETIAHACADDSVVLELRVPPRRNNLLIGVQVT